MIDQLRKLILAADPATASPELCQLLLDFVQASMQTREAAGGGGAIQCVCELAHSDVRRRNSSNSSAVEYSVSAVRDIGSASAASR